MCFIFTQWDEIKKYDITNYEKLMKNPIVLDGRNCYNLHAFKNTNIKYESMGIKCIFKEKK